MFNNLTPHVINILDPDGNVVKTVDPSGIVTRCAVMSNVVGSVDGVLLYETSFGEVEDLPEQENEVINIVSLLVRQACPDRDDLFSPGQLIRDESGQPIGCAGLTR